MNKIQTFVFILSIFLSIEAIHAQINNNMDKFTEIFIAEMGAYVKGEIKGLCNLVKPQYGILTRIGTAHLESFGSEQNIIDGKFELIESLPSNGIGILNK